MITSLIEDVTARCHRYVNTMVVGSISTRGNVLLFINICISSFWYLKWNSAFSRIKQGRQREPNIKALSFPVFAQYSRHCVSGGGTQRWALALVPDRRNENIDSVKHLCATTASFHYK